MDRANFQRFDVIKRTVCLSGGRCYAICPADVTRLLVWLPGSAVHVAESRDRAYPVVLWREDYAYDQVWAQPLSEAAKPRKAVPEPRAPAQPLKAVLSTLEMRPFVSTSNGLA